MASGYTKDIGKGISFQQYAAQCAKSCGALYHMRDEPHSEEIPRRLEVCTSQLEAGKAIALELEKIEQMSKAEAEEAAATQNKEKEIAHAKDVTQQIRYEEMRQKVQEWEPPSDDHVDLKTFMLQQIEDSITFDLVDVHPPEKITGNEWQKAKIKNLRSLIAYHDNRYKREVKSIALKNKWLKLLHESLVEKIHNWDELAKVKDSPLYTLKIYKGSGNGWIVEKESGKFKEYLSTHTFYGSTHEDSTHLLQAYGFNIMIVSWEIP